MTEDLPARPMPPKIVTQILGHGIFVPAPEVVEWIRAVLIDPAGPLYNEDHDHLESAEIGVLWTNADNSKKGRRVIGTAEIPMFRCGAWQKARQEQQIHEWFRLWPDFIITLDAYYCQDCSDVEFLALIEHELYHCAQATDAFGMPKFNRMGQPSWTIKGHDVEEFIGVVRRYGVVSEEINELVQAAQQEPEVTKVNVARACGTCMLKSA